MGAWSVPEDRLFVYVCVCVCTHISVINIDYKCCTRKWKWTFNFYLQRKSPFKKMVVLMMNVYNNVSYLHARINRQSCFWSCAILIRSILHTLSFLRTEIFFFTVFEGSCLKALRFKFTSRNNFTDMLCKKNSSHFHYLRAGNAPETVKPSTSSSYSCKIITFLQTWNRMIVCYTTSWKVHS
jgi:hypothetical protein